MRYTEARLTAIAEELLRDIRHDTVDFRDNYDATLREPIVLPAALPQLLMNGSTGIAVGMATNIPPHNLARGGRRAGRADRRPRPADQGPAASTSRAPTSRPAGRSSTPRAELRQIYETGQGPVRVRCAVQAREDRPPQALVVITSIPYTTNKASIVEEIAEHIISRKLPLAVDVRDESTDDVRVVVEIKPDASADAVMAYLFKHTSLQMNFNVNLTALVPTGRAGVGQPARLTLLELCRHFLDFRRDVVRRRLDARARRAARAPAHPRRVPQALRRGRPRHQDHPRAPRRARRAARPDEGLRARRGAGRRDPRDSPLPTGAAGDRQDPRRAAREGDARRARSSAC